MKCYFLSDMIFYSAKPQNSKAIDTVKPHEEEQEMKQRLSVLFFSLFWLGYAGEFSHAELFWGGGGVDWGTGASGPSSVVYRLDSNTGLIDKTMSFESYDWMWINGIADSGKYLYISHNTYDIDGGSYMDTHDFKIAKVDRCSGAVLSDVSISGFLGQGFSQVNALDFHDGNLYGVDNVTSNSTLRGYALQMHLDQNGDVVNSSVGAFVGPYPDCGLDFNKANGLWYATSWGYTPPPKKEGSLLFTSPDIMSTNFTQEGVGNSAVSGIGMISGLAFSKTGDCFAVSWYGADHSATSVYSVDVTLRTATPLYDLAPQLPSSVTYLDGLADVNMVREGCKNGPWRF